MAAEKKRQLNPLDLYDIRSELTEEECIVQDSVARFVDSEVLPIIREAFENHSFLTEDNKSDSSINYPVFSIYRPSGKTISNNIQVTVLINSKMH